jgi:oligopeptide/dipeptide ABC transporter ATP-binding protein
MGLSYLFIAHDLSVVRHVSHRIAVMYLGQIVELGPSKRLFEAPAHPYTRALLSAIPVPDPTRRSRRLVLTGDVPSPLNPPAGCRFHTRCPPVMDRCRVEAPRAYGVEPGHSVACFHAEGLENLGDPDWSTRIGERIDGQVTANGNDGRTRELPALPRAAELKAARTERDGTRDARSPGAPQGRTRNRPPRGVIVLALLLALAGTVLLRRARLTREAEDTLRSVRSEIEARKAITGAYPERLSDLGWRLFPLFPGGNPVDPWGRALRYRVRPDGQGYDLGSEGSAGAPTVP